MSIECPHCGALIRGAKRLMETKEHDEPSGALTLNVYVDGELVRQRVTRLAVPSGAIGVQSKERVPVECWHDGGPCDMKSGCCG